MKNRLKSFLCHHFPILMTKYFYKKILHKSLNLKHPKTFNEKINWLKLYYWPTNNIAIQCADKYKVREYIEKKGCQDILNDIIGVWDNANDINWNMLPNKFAIKCNHGCGMNIICHDKNNFDIENAKNKLNKWMKFDWGKEAIEPHYSHIKPLIICEKYIESDDETTNTLPADIKIHCFFGKPKVIAYYSGRGNDLHGTFYDTSWKKLPFGTKDGQLVEKPICLTKMLEDSKILSADLPYVRVDFYESNGKPIFGEMTFTPASGRSPYMTEEADIYMGNLLDLNKLNM